METVSESHISCRDGRTLLSSTDGSNDIIPSRRRESAISTTSTDSDDLRCCCCCSGAGSLSRDMHADQCGSHTESALSDGRDSGVEADTFVPPDEGTGRCIAEAVEYYFSNENLLKDAFLLKHVKRNKEGYVSLKLISSFKHVKHITRDWRVVAYSIRYSVQLQLNEEGTKVRRVQPLPEYDETVTSRTIVAVNLPLENPTIASVSQLFSRCGDITSIRVLKPSTNIPVEVRAAFNKRPEIIWEGVNCAVVEFDRQDHARIARETMTTAIADDDESGMHILPIGKVSNKKKSRQEDTKLICREFESVSLEAAAAEFETQKKRRQRRKKPLVHMDSRSSLSGTDGEFSAPGSRRSTPPQGQLMPLFSQPPPLLPLPPPGMRIKRLTPPANGVCSQSSMTARPNLGIFHCTDIRLNGDIQHHPLPHPHQQFQQASLHYQHVQPPLYPHNHQHGARGKSLSTPSMLPLVPDVTLSPVGPSRQKKSHSFSGVPQQPPTPPAAGCHTGNHEHCQWMQRRKASGSFDQDRRGSLASHDNVMREPRGPDGSRGFGGGFGSRRPSRTSTTIAPTIEEMPGDEAAAAASMSEEANVKSANVCKSMTEKTSGNGKGTSEEIVVVDKTGNTDMTTERVPKVEG